MITFLTSAKSFLDPVGQNQLRAIRSWMQAAPDAEIILYGRSDGAEHVCRDPQISYIPNIKSSPSGAPYFNAIASHASKHAKYDLQIYLNCDILLTSSILEALAKVNFPKYLIVGQRIDLTDGVVIDVHSEDYLLKLKEIASYGKATLHSPGAMDYFVFQRGMWQGLKPLIIGRAGYDSALVAHCLREGIPIIDATLSVLALHQFHEYGHVGGGQKEISYGSEAEQNKRLHGILHNGPNTADAGWILKGNQLIPTQCRGDTLRQLEIYIRFVLRIGPTWMVLRALWRFLVATGIYTPPSMNIQDVISAHLEVSSFVQR